MLENIQENKQIKVFPDFIINIYFDPKPISTLLST